MFSVARSRTITTDESGAYTAPDLQPGNYKIHVEAKGFKSVERPNVQIEVATDVRADFALQPGQVTETVTISEEVPLINTTSATLGGTLSNKEINDLPLNGRNYENLLQLRPGVMRYPGGGFSTTSTNGLRAEDNAYFIEGLFNSEPFSGQGIINGAGIAGDSATILPIDAIQEFNVQENPPAEYGWKPGAIMNVGLKSGTNSHPRHRVCLRPRRRRWTRATISTPCPPQKLREPWSSSAAVSAARLSKTRRSSSALTKASATTWATRTASPRRRWCLCPTPDELHFGHGRLRQQHSERDCRSRGQQRPDQRGQPADLGLHGVRIHGELCRHRIPHQQHAGPQHRARIPQRCAGQQRAGQSGLQHQPDATASAACISTETTTGR